MAEFYPLLFGRGFSLPQLLFFLLLLLTLVQGPSTGPQGRRRFASPWGRPAAAPTPASPGALRTALPCTLLPVFSPLRVLLPSAAR